MTTTGTKTENVTGTKTKNATLYIYRVTTTGMKKTKMQLGRNPKTPFKSAYVTNNIAGMAVKQKTATATKTTASTKTRAAMITAQQGRKPKMQHHL